MYTKLKELREKNHYTIKEMAEKCHISSSYYFQLENKHRRLYYDLAVIISNVFGLKPDDIFYLDKKKEN